MIVAIQVLHGICYAFFFATVYIFVDTYFPKDVRSSAQGLFNVMILGLGVLAANTLGPWLMQSVFTATGVTDFRSMFLLPCLTALGAAIVLAVAFRPPAQSSDLDSIQPWRGPVQPAADEARPLACPDLPSRLLEARADAQLEVPAAHRPVDGIDVVEPEDEVAEEVRPEADADSSSRASAVRR